jgi:hypothetical protein
MRGDIWKLLSWSSHASLWPFCQRNHDYSRRNSEPLSEYFVRFWRGGNGWFVEKIKEDSSFSEEKEAKRLLFSAQLHVGMQLVSGQPGGRRARQGEHDYSQCEAARK